jgi:hypothetical protein
VDKLCKSAAREQRGRSRAAGALFRGGWRPACGAGLLLDALGRTRQVADMVGIRALAVHAKDDQGAAFYRHFGFVPSPTDPRHLSMIDRCSGQRISSPPAARRSSRSARLPSRASAPNSRFSRRSSQVGSFRIEARA